MLFKCILVKNEMGCFVFVQWRILCRYFIPAEDFIRSFYNFSLFGSSVESAVTSFSHKVNQQKEYLQFNTSEYYC